jgi:hypothetical protein
MIEPENWDTLFWNRGDRYYICRLSQNLFGEWIVEREWGGRNSGKRGRLERAFPSLQEAESLVRQVARRRSYQRYEIKA